MAMKQYIERLLDRFGFHSPQDIESRLITVINRETGEGIYDITSVCRVCSMEIRDRVYRKEWPVIDDDFKREHYKIRDRN